MTVLLPEGRTGEANSAAPSFHTLCALAGTIACGLVIAGTLIMRMLELS